MWRILRQSASPGTHPSGPLASLSILQTDNYLGGGNTPGGAVAPTLVDAANHNAGALITIPMAGYASADKLGNGDVRYNGNTWNGSTWVNGTPNPNYLAERFNQMLARKPGGGFSLNPDTTDDFVYADEFVNWVKTNYGYGQTDANKPIWFSLDNEPDLWNSTHAEVHPAAPTYVEMVQRTTDWSKAIKDVEPGALVFGPVNYGWQGYIRLQDAPDANGRDFQQFYLAQMKAASQAAGRRLLDVMETTSRKPDSVSRVNSTPEAPTSERTISCTPADRNTSSCLKPWCTR